MIPGKSCTHSQFNFQIKVKISFQLKIWLTMILHVHTQTILHGDYHDDDDTHLDGTAHRFLCEMQAMEPFCHDL